jgi:hypothetical protein
MFPQGDAGTEKKMVYSCIIKTKWCATSEISGGDKLGGQSGRGEGKEGERRDATREVTWSRVPSQSGCDPADAVKSAHISMTRQ